MNDHNSATLLGQLECADEASARGHCSLLRQRGPVFWDHSVGAWLVTHHSAALAVLSSDRFTASRFQIDCAQLPAGTQAIGERVNRIAQQQFAFCDGSRHRRLRRPFARLLGSRRLAQLQTHLCTQLDEALNRVARRGIVDTIGELAIPFVSSSIRHVLGIRGDWLDYYSLVVPAANLLDGKLRTLKDVVESLTCLARLYDLLAERVQPNSTEGAPHEKEEYVANLLFAFVAGHESSAHLIGTCLLALQRDSSLRERAQQRRGAEQIVEEALRYDSPIQAIGRVARAQTPIEEVTVEEGDRLLVHIGCANHDPSVFSDPGAFLPDRQPRSHVSFGAGAHACPGASLVKLEASLFLQRFVASFPRFEALEDSKVWTVGTAARGLSRLDVVLDGRSGTSIQGPEPAGKSNTG